MAEVQRILCLIGTQSFTAESLADELSETFQNTFPPSSLPIEYEIILLDDYDYVEKLATENRPILFLVSTFGLGDPPHSAMCFAEWLLTLSPSTPLAPETSHLEPPFFEGIQYSVFGLGSKNFADFAAFGILLDQKMAELGGKRFGAFATGDAACNLRGDFFSWARQTLSCLPPSFGISSASCVKERKIQTSADVFRSCHQPGSVCLRVQKRVQLCLPDCEIEGVEKNMRRSVMHVKIEGVKGEGGKRELLFPEWLQPGDHIGIYPKNSSQTVERALNILCVSDPSTQIPIFVPREEKGGWVKEERKVQEILENHIDLVGHCGADVLRKFIPWISSLSLRAQARCLTHVSAISMTDQDQSSGDNFDSLGQEENRNKEENRNEEENGSDVSLYEKWVPKRPFSILDLMESFECRPTIRAFLNCAPRMEPRLYSIAETSLLPSSSSLSICVSLFTFTNSQGKDQKGLCTEWLCESLPVGGEMKAFFRQSGFHPIFSKLGPTVMFGVGSGIGPFYGSLCHYLKSEGILVPDVQSPSSSDRGKEEELIGNQESDCSSCVQKSVPRKTDEGSSDLLSSHYLFFGCQTPESILYRDHLNLFSLHGLNFSLALSRVLPKTYVQNAALRKGGELWRVLNHPHCTVYLCGRTDMVEGVKKGIVELGMMRGLTESEAKSFIDQLVHSNSWCVDSWILPSPPVVANVTPSQSSSSPTNMIPEDDLLPSPPKKKKMRSHIEIRLEQHIQSPHPSTLSLPNPSSPSCQQKQPKTKKSKKSSPPEWPSYLRLLATGELERRVACAQEMWSACVACGRNCEVNRLSKDPQDWGECRVGEYAIVSSAGPHFGEEDCLRGTKGSGTIFFGACNLKCVYCQNYEISAMDEGEVLNDQELAQVMLNLQKRGCHNINFVSPTHNVAPILRALLIAAKKGLNKPLVYNTGGYDTVASLRLLDGIIDIYMPDMKYANRTVARKLSGIDNYPDVNQAAVREMYRQVGDLQFDKRGLATKGVLVRHLVLPNDLAGTRDVTRFLITELSKEMYINVMPQYQPYHKAKTDKKYGIHRKVTEEEIDFANEEAKASGVERFDHRWLEW